MRVNNILEINKIHTENGLPESLFSSDFDCGIFVPAPGSGRSTITPAAIPVGKKIKRVNVKSEK